MILTKLILKSSLILIILFLSFIFNFCQKTGRDNQYQIVLRNNWYLRSSAEVQAGGDLIASPRFDLNGWYPTNVPSTVLAALVKNNVYQNPFFGKNLENIPTE